MGSGAIKWHEVTVTQEDVSAIEAEEGENDET